MAIDITKVTTATSNDKPPLKVFISMPMRDKTPQQIAEETTRVHKVLKENLASPFIVLSSYLGPDLGVTKNPLWCLGVSLKVMSDADVVFFAKGYDKYRGCLIEEECASQYSVPLIIAESDDSNYHVITDKDMEKYWTRENSKVFVR